MEGYRQFWNKLFFGTEEGFAGTFDTSEYWLRVVAVVAVCLLLGVASMRFPRLPAALTTIFVAVWVISVVPFLLWAASCGGCGSAASYDSARSLEAMQINQWWGGMLAMATASVWIGSWAVRRLR